ncbi:MAG: glycosyltransferase [Clostridiales bacterium]|nr:glycosyltransferase [Clostridiales bacterium]
MGERKTDCKNSSPKVSVIMPVYNTEKYLRESLDSLLAQTFSDFEIICVDDGSTDSSRSILWEYAVRDARIRVLEQNNLTAGAARNRGLSVAQGEYVIFLDGDDFFAPELLESTYQAAVDNQADIVLFDWRRYDNTNKKVQECEQILRYDLIPDTPVFSRRDIPDNILLVTNPAPWNKLFSRAYLLSTGLQFQALPNANDFYFVMGELALANRICVVNKVLVYYRINAKTNTQNGKHRNPLCFLNAITALYNLLNDRGVYEEIKDSFIYVSLSCTLFNLSTVQTDQARWCILDALEQESVQRMELFQHAAEEQNTLNYVNRQSQRLAQSISAAMRQYRQTRATWNLEPPQMVIPYRADTPVYVSVIVPVYNVAPYLNQMFSSLVHQSLHEIEIICVDDGSTDDSLNILRQWAEKDPRISVYTQENMGPSRSRNVAMAAATGEYIFFMDSDDYLELDALEQLYQRATRDQLEIVYFDAATVFENEDLRDENPSFGIASNRSFSYDQIYDGPSLFTLFQFKGDYCAVPWLQFSRREFICQHHIQFHVGIVHEDNAFVFAAILNAKRVAHIHKRLYNHRIRPNSIMTQQTSFRNSYGYFVSFMDMYAAFLEVEPQLSQEAHTLAEVRLCNTIKSAQDCYRKMPREQWDSELGLGDDYRFFQTLVRRPAELQQNGELYYEQLQDVREKLKTANDIKAEVYGKLRREYAIKADLNERLKRAYAEKTEINARLHRTYDEKRERGVQIKKLKGQLEAAQKTQTDLKKQLKAAKKQNAALKRSYSYRLGRALTAPLRAMKRLWRKIRKGK